MTTPSVLQAVQLCHKLLLWVIPQLDKFPRVRRFTLARIIHEHFCCIADPLLRRAFGQRARSSDPHCTARVRIGASGLHALVSRRGSAISRRTVMNNAG